MQSVEIQGLDKVKKALEAAGETAYEIGEVQAGEKGVELC